jgi:hypothetical protein
VLVAGDRIPLMNVVDDALNTWEAFFAKYGMSR